MPIAAHIQPALRDAHRCLRELYADRLLCVVLYGSQARGDAHANSDVDVLVVLRNPFELYSETKRLVLLALDLFDRYGHHVSFQPFTEEDYRNPASSFMETVRAEGIEL